MANNSKIQNDVRLEGGAVDQEIFESAIRENLSPEGVAMAIALLRTAGNYRSASNANKNAQLQVEWLANTLINMFGVEEYVASHKDGVFLRDVSRAFRIDQPTTSKVLAQTVLSGRVVNLGRQKGWAAAE